MTDIGSQIPQDQPAMERGLLDLSVALPTRNITAGKQFAIFVLVKNPFDKPVWVRQVHVSLSSELKLAGVEDIKRQKRKEKDDNENNFQRENGKEVGSTIVCFCRRLLGRFIDRLSCWLYWNLLL